MFYIDIIPGGDPSNKYADFRIVYETYIVLGAFVFPIDEAVLQYWNGIDWDDSICTDVHGDSMGSFVEVAVAWDCIGGQNCFNCFFSASTSLSPTDWAPDLDAQYIMIGCCPGRPPEPVGGEIIPRKILSAATPVVSIAISVFLAVGVIAFSKKKHYH
jgi:hypothetical protein